MPTSFYNYLAAERRGLFSQTIGKPLGISIPGRDMAHIPYISKFKNIFELNCDATDTNEVVFDPAFLTLGKKVCNEFIFNNSLKSGNSVEHLRSESVRDVSQQVARVNCYLQTSAVEVRYLTNAASQERHMVLRNWFKNEVVVNERLIFDNVT